jgi:hypothetical protein
MKFTIQFDEKESFVHIILDMRKEKFGMSIDIPNPHVVFTFNESISDLLSTVECVINDLLKLYANEK